MEEDGGGFILDIYSWVIWRTVAAGTPFKGFLALGSPLATSSLSFTKAFLHLIPELCDFRQQIGVRIPYIKGMRGQANGFGPGPCSNKM
jgi:hypothetical protein